MRSEAVSLADSAAMRTQFEDLVLYAFTPPMLEWRVAAALFSARQLQRNAREGVAERKLAKQVLRNVEGIERPGIGCAEAMISPPHIGP